MNCNVMPLKKYSEISYRVKCVAVENERVFGDVYITQQTRNLTRRADGYLFPSICRRRKRNLIHQVLDTPDFMELNSKQPNRRANSVGNHQVIQKVTRRTKSMGDDVNVIMFNRKDVNKTDSSIKEPKVYPMPLSTPSVKKEIMITSLVDELLLDIYGFPIGDRGRSESDSTASSLRLRPQHQYLQKARLLLKNENELQILVTKLHEHITHTGGLLVRQLRRKDHLMAKRDKQCTIITAHLQACSEKRIEDTKMRFSLTPQPGESGFIQWLDAMKMVARLQGGIPTEFRKRLWLTLAERHLEQRGVDWKQAEKVCFNEWSNPDDEELGIQIVKDLHRTGCSLFCGAAGRDNQAVLRRVLLGFARWNKSVGYCQGLNVLAALVLQVMDRAESSAVKVMIYLIEGVLPEGYFADNLRGLSVDMAVFRDLLRSRLPKLSKHLEALQSDAKDKATGSSYEPPLTNVFTMQWFLTLFCHCLPQEAVLRVWDLIFLEGDEILLRTALAIWEGLSDRIMTVTSADEFYSIMGVLTREMLEFTDTNNLIKNIVSMGPLHGVTSLREKHRYNITPWARKLSDDDDTDTEEDERLAVAAAMFNMAQRLKKERIPATMGALQAMAPSNDRERLALDISTLKQQYAKLRERQRQAHIILSAACARQSMVPPPTSQAMNHLLVGKSALVSGKNRPLSLPSNVITPKARPTVLYSPRTQNRKERQDVTLYWKDTKRPKQKSNSSPDTEKGGAPMQLPENTSVSLTSPKRGSADSDSDSTSTELCDEPERLSDVDSEEATSTSDNCVMAVNDERNFQIESPPLPESSSAHSPRNMNEPIRIVEDIDKSDITFEGKQSDENLSLGEISIAKITDQIRRLSAEDDNNIMVPQTLDTNESNEKSPVDSFITRSSIKDVGTNFNVDYNVDKSAAKKSMSTVKNYGYLGFSYNVEPSVDESKIHEIRSNALQDVPAFSKEETLLPKDKIADTSVNIEFSQTNSDTYEDYRGTSFEKNYGKTFTPLDTSEERFDTSFNVSNNISTMIKAKENLDTTVTTLSETTITERNFYLKPYSTSRPSISPTTAEQTLNKTMHISHNTDNPTAMICMNVQETYTNPVITMNMSTLSDKQQLVQTKLYQDTKKSPKTPESIKSFSSGETMGPDSKPSSSAVSPRTPVRSDSRDFLTDKSACSSTSSDSKTLILHSTISEVTKNSSKIDAKKDSYEKSSPSTPISTDSLKNKSDTSPKLIVSSSSDSCSPSKLKSSERSFSSDLQSPISANSIKYTSNYNKRGQDNISDSPTDLSATTSPFYPIAHPNQKTPSPYSTGRRKCSIDSAETSPEQKSLLSKDSTKPLSFQSKLHSTLKPLGSKDKESAACGKVDVFDRSEFNLKKDDVSKFLSLKEKTGNDGDSYEWTGNELYRRNKQIEDDNLDEKDTVPQLPQEKLDKHFFSYNYRHRDRPKLFERSSSSLERRFADLKSSASTDEFRTTMAKKRSSDILEDIKHLEAKAFRDGAPDASMLSKKTSYIWEDLKNLEARRQDTFSNSARGFSKQRIEVSDTNITGENRKSYVVHPKINIDEGSDSILRTVSCNKDNGDSDDGRELKLGVWTKVKPRKKGDNGRRSSDRALKIIQENSAILHKILACQAKKRLPDLEEISKEITISPINEEISKIFSPILEKMGLNEHEINEELAKINFKDFDNMTATSVSELDAKINDELSKLSLIDDSEKIDHLDVDQIISHDYLNTREALIDRKINEELSKLLANYEENSPPSVLNIEKGSSSQNISDIEGLDLTSVSTNVFSYKSSNDSIETRSDVGSAQDTVMQSDKFPQYGESILSYTMSKYEQDLSPKSDIDIYQELEKLDKISSVKILPDSSMSSKVMSPTTYTSNSSPYSEATPTMRYPGTKTGTYDTSPLKRSYDPFNAFEFKIKLSPRKTPNNPYNNYEKSTDKSFEYLDLKPGHSTNTYDLHLNSPILTKESLEFRVRYDDEPIKQPNNNEYLPLQTDGRQLIDLNKGVPYYGDSSNKPLTPTKYIPKEERCLDTPTSFLEYSNGKTDFLRRKYDSFSPKEYSHGRISAEYDKHLLLPIESESNNGSYLPAKHRDYHSLSPNRQSGDFAPTVSYYSSKSSPGLGDETKRPVSHPEFPGKVNVKTYSDSSERGASCYKKSSLSLGNIDHNTKAIEESYEQATSPKTQFSPFPVRNVPRKPKELTLKLGLYSPKVSDVGQLKRS